MNITPTPEFMEAVGRVFAKYGQDPARWPYAYCIQEEMRLMREHGDSVRAGLTGVEEQHAAVAAAYPHLYTAKTD
jgi:hypothetical protein